MFGLEPDKRRAALKLTAELLTRYDRPGSRHPSDPTSLDFHEDFTVEDEEETADHRRWRDFRVGGSARRRRSVERD